MKKINLQSISANKTSIQFWIINLYFHFLKLLFDGRLSAFLSLNLTLWLEIFDLFVSTECLSSYFLSPFFLKIDFYEIELLLVFERSLNKLFDDLFVKSSFFSSFFYKTSYYGCSSIISGLFKNSVLQLN